MADRPHLTVVLEAVRALEDSAVTGAPNRCSPAGIDDRRVDAAERRAALERRRSMRDHPAAGARSRPLAAVSN
jgi:hypothetical protein